MKGTEMNEQVSADETINEKGDADFSKNLEVVNQNEQNSMSSFQEEEQAIKKKYGGIIPKKPPLISKDHERASFDSADWALGKQGAHVEKAKGPLEALRPKLQMNPYYAGLNFCAPGGMWYYSYPPSTQDSQGSPSQVPLPSRVTQGAEVGDEVVEVEAPITSKKGKKTTKKNKGEGKTKGNMFWSKEMADFLVEFLAEQARQGMKVDKGLKRPALVACAREVSKKFGKVVTVDHVKSKLSYVKKKFGKLKEALNQDGAEWDDENKVLKLAGPVYHDFIREHPYMKNWLNCPLNNYDDLALVCGADFASGDGVRSIYMGFGAPAEETINIEDYNEQIIQNGQPAPTPSRVMPMPQVASSSSTKKAKKAKTTSSKRSNCEQEREVAAERFFQGMAMLADSITRGPEHWMDKLGKAVMGMEAHGYNVLLLGAAMGTLMRDEVEGRCFLNKPLELRKHWLELYKAKYEAEYGPLPSHEAHST